MCETKKSVPTSLGFFLFVLLLSSYFCLFFFIFVMLSLFVFVYTLFSRRQKKKQWRGHFSFLFFKKIIICNCALPRGKKRQKREGEREGERKREGLCSSFLSFFPPSLCPPLSPPFFFICRQSPPPTPRRSTAAGSGRI